MAYFSTLAQVLSQQLSALLISDVVKIFFEMVPIFFKNLPQDDLEPRLSQGLTSETFLDQAKTATFDFGEQTENVRPQN
jgi:hypothetical protein